MTTNPLVNPDQPSSANRLEPSAEAMTDENEPASPARPDDGELLFGGAGIFGGAGAYTISVRFKASSGSVTASNRKLWVEALSFS